MPTRFAIGILSALICVISIAPAQAQSQSYNNTYTCYGAGTVHTYTESMTVNVTNMLDGNSVNGSFSSTYPNAQCGGYPGQEIIETYISDFGGGYGTTWVVTDSQGTHTCGPVTQNNYCEVYGTSGSYNATFTFTPPSPNYASYEVPPYQFSLAGEGAIDNGGPYLRVTVLRDNSADLGAAAPRSGCEGRCGSPINLTNGNTWIQRQDYSVPGIAGGLQVTRTWNSMWGLNFPFQQSGMFGDSWQSNYEEHVQTTSSGATYWRADGSAFKFSYNSKTKTYNIVSPPDERASLVYSSHTGLITVTLLDGSQRIFNSSGYLTGLVDRNGNQITVTLDKSNRVTQVADPAGRTLTFNYATPNSSKLVSSIQDSVGTIATYGYDAGGHLTSVIYADGSVVNYNYDLNGLILNSTDAQGKVLESHTYNNVRRGYTSARANGADLVTVSYSSGLPQTASLSDSNGNASTYGVTRIGTRDYVSSVAGSGCDTCGGRGNYSFTYDSQGNRLTSTDPLGHLTKFAYDSNGNVTQKQVQSDSTGTNFQTWQYTYNSFAEVLTATDPLGNVTTNTYDTKGNLLTATTPSPSSGVSGSTTVFTYDTKGELLTITDPNGNKTTLAYTGAGLNSSITDAKGNITQFQYDSRSNRTALISALNQQTVFAYDLMNRVTKITYPTSPATFTQFAYDYRGRKSSVTDPDGKITQYAYDDADRLISVTDPKNGVMQYAYDNENNLTSITDTAGNKTGFLYDAYGRVTQTNFPSSMAETFSYDLDGNLLTKTDRNGHVINYGYDFLNRLASKTYPDSTVVNYAYDLANRLTQVSDPTGTYGFTYDKMNRLTQTSTAYSFIMGKTFTVGFAYDAASNRTSMTDPQNAGTTYAYDTLNRLITLTYPTSTNYSFAYDALSRRTQLTRPNGIATNYQYDSLSRLLSVLHQSGSTVLDGAAYLYDSAGNRTSKTDERTNATVAYGYDALYELTSVLQGGNTTESYTYDAVGNRLSSLGTSPYSYNTSNELTSKPGVTYTYDNNGNSLTKVDSTGTTTYNWDFENRLTQVTLPGSGGTVTFKYDPVGHRIQKSFTQNGTTTTTNYVYDGANVLEEVDGSGNVVARYVQGIGIDEPLAETRGSTTSYYEADGLGSVTSLSNSSATLANTYAYDSYGQLTGATGTAVNPYRYTGRESDSETGFYYYRARYYDPLLGRFLGEDPVGFDSDANFYRYVNNAPTNTGDPAGLWSPGAHDALIRHALGRCGVADFVISEIQQDSRDWDEMSQAVNQSNYHSMATPEQTAQEAIDARNQIIADYLNRAELQYENGRTANAYWDFAVAIHVLMDMTSPAHTDGNGNPYTWYGWSDPRSKAWRHSPNDITGIERVQDITPSVYSLDDDGIRTAYQFMTGKALCNCK